MGKLRELINIFINPVQPEKSLDELAAEVGIKASDLELLKKSANGVEGTWKFADDIEETKKRKNSKVSISEQTQIQSKPRTVVKEDKQKEYERD